MEENRAGNCGYRHSDPPQYVVQTLSDILNGAGIIVTEVGQNQMWAAQHFSFTRPRQWITSGGLGTMGYGFPAAIGASIACLMNR